MAPDTTLTAQALLGRRRRKMMTSCVPRIEVLRKEESQTMKKLALVGVVGLPFLAASSGGAGAAAIGPEALGNRALADSRSAYVEQVQYRPGPRFYGPRGYAGRPYWSARPWAHRP